MQTNSEAPKPKKLVITDVVEPRASAPKAAAPAPKAAAPTAMQLQHVPVEKLHPSPHNPRQDFPKESLQQLAHSIGLHGVQEPLKARPSKSGLELVFGHRRLRAAQLAGLKELPVLVQEMTDLQVAEAQLAENIDREDLAPLEVAGGYKRLLDLGQSMDKVCERSGKKRSAIYATLKLLDLSPEAKKALGDGTITGSVGQLFAKWVPPAMQGKALQQLQQENHTTYRDVLKFFLQEYGSDLKKASFDIKDAQLYAAAGACGTCKKRSGANPDLFGDDSKSPDICSDRACFDQKIFLTAKKNTDKAGLRLLTPAETESVFSYGDTLAHDGPYVRPNDSYFEDHQRRSYKELLEPEQLKALTVAAVVLDTGKTVELLPRANLKKALAKAGKFKTWQQAQKEREKNKPKTSGSGASAYKPPPPSVDDLVDRALIGKLVEAAEKMGPTPKLLKLVAAGLLADQEYVYERRGMEDPGYGRLDEKAFDKAWGKLTPAKLAGLLLEVVLDKSYSNGDGFEDELEFFGVDEKKVRAEVERANSIAWETKGAKTVGKGKSGTVYTLTKDKHGFDVSRTGWSGAETGTGAGGSGPFKTLELAKENALHHESTAPKKKKAA